ncbi:selenate reductase [Acetobacterium tundrae]|uniref:Selenate reductase n=1 Tax=Acetobacterium tundrae TaxID=132932 RepID=A0ABR6WHD7_9FIRM|nr:selenate reductase [Acetobacterium tundrae]MBC3795641.1 selenate reductase [Acetobacterium tundrae]
MSDVMNAIPFGRLMNHILEEYRLHHTIFNVSKIIDCTANQQLSIMGSQIENPIGPAAGPHTQLAQNIVACYAAGGRFFELKTIQQIYGEDLGIPRPCINSRDEAYNVEWSAEYSADKAMEEYIKAWYALKLISREFGLGDPDAFVFNMSVGYNLEGIKSKTVDDFIEGLKNAGNTSIWAECEAWSLNNLARFKNIDAAYVGQIPSQVSQSVTLSTMHGCPADEIEAITSYLIEEKRLYTCVKCNPTLLGYELVRKTLDKMGYDYIAVDDQQFKVDLQFNQAVSMLSRLQNKAKAIGLDFGVKLSNTLPVKVNNNELPGEQMYMSGKSLYPLTIMVAEKISEAFDGKMLISYSGGVDKDNVAEIFQCGIWPITVCTVLLKGLGLDQMAVISEKLSGFSSSEERLTDIKSVKDIVGNVTTDKHYIKSEAARKKYNESPGFTNQRDDSIYCKALCKNCVRACPNRANEIVELVDTKLIVHIDGSCNECGNCACNCVEPCQPYLDRLTFFDSGADFHQSKNQGFCQLGDQWLVRWENTESQMEFDSLPETLKGVVGAFNEQHPYYLI